MAASQGLLCGLATALPRSSATGSLPASWFRGLWFNLGMQFFNTVMLLQTIVGRNAMIVAGTATTRG
jgi:hypothetical protein